MEKTIKVGVEGSLGKKNFSTYIIGDGFGKYGVHGYGATAMEAMEDTRNCYGEMREIARENGDELPDVKFEFHLDIGSLFSCHPYLNISAVAQKMGINPSLMRKYASGVCKPSKKRTEEITSCLRTMAKELNTVNLV